MYRFFSFRFVIVALELFRLFRILLINCEFLYFHDFFFYI